MERPPKQHELFPLPDPSEERPKGIEIKKGEIREGPKQKELFFRKEPPKNNKKIKREREKRTVRGLIAGFHQKNNELLRQDEVRHKQFIIDRARGSAGGAPSAEKNKQKEKSVGGGKL